MLGGGAGYFYGRRVGVRGGAGVERRVGSGIPPRHFRHVRGRYVEICEHYFLGSLGDKVVNGLEINEAMTIGGISCFVRDNEKKGTGAHLPFLPLSLNFRGFLESQNPSGQSGHGR